jgi:hypothetical protein
MLHIHIPFIYRRNHIILAIWHYRQNTSNTSTCCSSLLFNNSVRHTYSLYTEEFTSVLPHIKDIKRLFSNCFIHSDSLRAGRSGDRIPVWERSSAPVQTGSGGHQASYTMSTRSFPGVKRPGRGVDHPPTSNRG